MTRGRYPRLLGKLRPCLCRVTLQQRPYTLCTQWVRSHSPPEAGYDVQKSHTDASTNAKSATERMSIAVRDRTSTTVAKRADRA